MFGVSEFGVYIFGTNETDTLSPNTHTVVGNLVAGFATLSGLATRAVTSVAHAATGALVASVATLAGFSYIGDFPVSLSHFISRQSARNFSSLSTRKTYVSTKKRP